MKKNLLIGYLLFSFFTVWGLTSLSIAEEKFPTKPITVLVGFAPGGSMDVTARSLGDFASKTLGQPVVVINKEGSSGALALAELKNANPDGYTLAGMVTGSVITAHMAKLPYHPVQDFDPIIQHSDLLYGIVVQADSPFKTLKDLIAYAKANPYKVNYGTGGVGTPQHLAMIQLGEKVNIKWTHVPFRGAVPAITALLGGHVTFCAQTAVFKTYVQSGRLRLLASLMENRLVGYPDHPTLVELGYNIVTPSLSCIIGPKGIPKDRVQILHDCFHKGMETAAFKEVLNKFDMQLRYRNPEDLKKFIGELYESTGKIIEKYRGELKE